MHIHNIVDTFTVHIKIYLNDITKYVFISINIS